MARIVSLKFLSFIFFVLLLSNSLFIVTEARPPRSLTSSKGIGIFFEEGLYLQGIKTGGPTPGGKGHAFTNIVRKLRVIINSGPSPGEGH
ncbi:PAMP-induced secreted peptide 2 [Quillaja saponaria]|uniref:PAMP-induced secreted peptide 2 n=1 Tax=Quillaja saponaria TaxID=32244 RepID=A0AAD7M0N0_QUISA|nr:PAMP-induced secreted peptide 2 [Quillaja saponaria]